MPIAAFRRRNLAQLVLPTTLQGTADYIVQNTVTRTVVQNITIGNGIGSNATVNLHFVKSGDSADSTNLFSFVSPGASNASCVSILPLGKVLEDGDSVFMFSTPNAVNVSVDGEEEVCETV